MVLITKVKQVSKEKLASYDMHSSLHLKNKLNSIVVNVHGKTYTLMALHLVTQLALQMDLQVVMRLFAA